MFIGKCNCEKCTSIRSKDVGKRVEYSPCANCGKQTPLSLKGGIVNRLCSTCDIKDKQANRHER